ncbi:MAG TPA: hypothetical protein VMJ92_02415 [Candidatus Limnocylindrales bacterium]|nr:hypothetical protein [Candidatus Limnocylindrales bacterium]
MLVMQWEGVMDEPEIERILEECERALAAGGRVDLAELGFWRAVAAVKRRPELIERHASRIAAIDRVAFLRGVPFAVPAAAGVALLVLGTAAGAALIVVSATLRGDAAGAVLLLGIGALLGTTHGLAHLVAGALAGIRFTHAFSVPPLRPQPGLKTDYATYLRASPRARAWMHASGAIVTKVVPFLALPLVGAVGAPAWTAVVLVAIGVLALVSDAVYSIRSSDWKKFRREMRLARARG